MLSCSSVFHAQVFISYRYIIYIYIYIYFFFFEGGGSCLDAGQMPHPVGGALCTKLS